MTWVNSVQILASLNIRRVSNAFINCSVISCRLKNKKRNEKMLNRTEVMGKNMNPTCYKCENRPVLCWVISVCSPMTWVNSVQILASLNIRRVSNAFINCSVISCRLKNKKRNEKMLNRTEVMGKNMNPTCYKCENRPVLCWEISLCSPTLFSGAELSPNGR